MKKVKMLAILASLFYCSHCIADDSWYVVHNYEGRIGKYPIHLSLQSFDEDKFTISGSYYYDKFHSVIALYGKQTQDSIELCEVSNRSDYEKYLILGEYDFKNCPFKLIKNGKELKGIWQNSKSKLDVSLSQTSFINKSTLKSDNEKVEIPFWGQTQTHSFIGIYEKDIDGGITINKIKVLDKKDGRVIQVIDPQLHDCQFGFFLTSIFENVENFNSSIITLNCYSARGDITTQYTFNKQTSKYIFVDEKKLEELWKK